MNLTNQRLIEFAEKALDKRKVDKIRKEKNSRQIEVFYCGFASATSLDGIEWERNQQMKSHEQFSRSLVWC